ncbi:penicillin-insensitive murein endopeptidase [Falsiphaeobacter marinintestinus]|uniref:penicillin-insensitive murein endopeptidase n=1 Tax=Falsiphaeobacter marinintestinus TaxID=1492905 RepID=UPI0011B57056|nr:penicillin-insensitive murein endopeptidase [Phaeobacter marinintestinus]
MTLFRIILSVLVLAFAAPVGAQTPAKQLFGAKDTGSRQKPAAYGSYSKGCVAGAAELAETGPTWQAMRLSRNRNWGHPDLVDYLQDLSKFAAKQPGWKGLYIGDLSQPRGGPMLSGHRSHQMGLDADIWMLPASRINLSRNTRENISSISVSSKNEASVNGNWSRAHHRILREAAKDKRVARIFVSPGIKVQMCKDETGNRRWLRKIRSWPYHNYHFHVRLACPKGAKGCTNQNPPPKGDGCAEAQQWVNNILNPPPPKPKDPNAPKAKPRKKGPYVLADLPQQCASVLQSQ